MRNLIAVGIFLFAVVRYVVAVDWFHFEVTKNLTAVMIFLGAVRCFLLVVTSLLKGVVIDLILIFTFLSF